MIGLSPSWAWQPNLVGWAAVGGMGLAYVVAVRRLGPRHSHGEAVVTLPKALCFAFGLLVLAAAFTWPVAGLARHSSLLVHMLRLSSLVLLAPPLLLLGLPRWLVEVATRPVWVDDFLRQLTSSVTATLIFNSVVIVSLLPPVVAMEARSAAVNASVTAALITAGAVMWVPVLRILPGPPQLSTGGRIGYLFIQSLLPNFPALIFIFSHHPLYAGFAHSARPALGISALADQQLAGVVAKLLGICVLWGVAAVILVRAQRAEDAGLDPDPLTWEDVERDLRRIDRRRRTDADS